MANIDDFLDQEFIDEYAPQVHLIPEERLKHFDTHFKGDKSLDYYLGILRGLGILHENVNMYSDFKELESHEDIETDFWYQIVFLCYRIKNIQKKQVVH